MNTRHTALSLALVLLLAAVAPAAAATAPVESDAVGDVTVTAAPGSHSASAAADAAAQSDSTDSIIARSDVAVVRLNASGVPAEADDDGTLLGDEVEFSLQQTDSNTPVDAEPKRLDATADTEGVAANATEDAVYVAVDLSEITLERGDNTTGVAVGDSFTASATLTDEVTDGENHTRETTFGVVEPTVRFVDNPTEAPAGEVVNYEVATTLAPGTSLTFTLVSGTSTEGTGTSTQITVGESSRGTGQFSFFTFDANEEYVITVSAEGAELNQTWTGQTAATETATEDSTETSTETSSTEAPGFGVVAALLALAGVGAVSLRRE